MSTYANWRPTVYPSSGAEGATVKCVKCGLPSWPITYCSTGRVSFPGGFPVYEVEALCAVCRPAPRAPETEHE